MASSEFGDISGDSFTDLAAVVSSSLPVLLSEGLTFIENLKWSGLQGFDVGNIPAFVPQEVNFDAEIGLSEAIRVVAPNFNLDDALSKIDALFHLALPSEPPLATPTLSLPDLNAVPPSVSLPSRPDATLPAAPSDAPSLQDVQPPEAPALTLPNTPTFEEFAIPPTPSFSLPTFAAVAPQNLLAPPTNTFAYVDTGYTSVLRDPLVGKLLSDLQNGGYGIDTTDEQALWDRARARALQQSQAEIDTAEQSALNSGFVLPQGIFLARQDKAREKLQQALSEINRDIALKRADLYVENRKFTIQEVRQYEQVAIALYNAIQERAFNASKAVADLGIAYYDAAVRNFNAQLEGYKAEAQVFEARVRAELGKAELYKTQIDAERLRGEFNQTKVNLYNAQLQGVQQTVNLYKSRVEAANLLAQLQAQKLEVFKSRVSIFSEQVRAKGAEFDMYKAGISGELAKLDIYKTEIDAYKSRVDAEETKARVTVLANQTLVQAFDAAVRKYAANVDAFSKTATARLDVARVQSSVYNSDIDAYRSYVTTLQEGGRIKAANLEQKNRWNIAALNSQIEQTKFRFEQLKATVNNTNTVNSEGAKLYNTTIGMVLGMLHGLTVKTAE